MNSTLGWQNEDKIVDAINKKHFKDIDNSLKYFISFMYPYAKDQDTLYCYKTEDFIKPDICIQWKDKNTFVSLKTGITNTVHGEFLDTFCEFLLKLGTPEKHVITFKKFCYGDGTIDGTGKVRKQAYEIRSELAKEIEEFNKFFEEHKDIVKEVVARCLFDGVNPQAYKADYIYYGNFEFGNFVSKKQVMNHIGRKSWMFMDCPHIGPLVLRPHARYAGKQILNENNRHRITITWPNLLPDIQYIQRRFNY